MAKHLTEGLVLSSNSGPFIVRRVGTGRLFLHPPTGRKMPLGTVIENPAGWFGTLGMDEGDRASWGWSKDMPDQE